MEFALTSTQAEIKDAARRYLTDAYPASRIADLSDSTGVDLTAWPELDRQGWLDPDLGMVELALLAEEGGHALHPTPWWTTAALAVPAYRAAGAKLPGPATLAHGSGTVDATQTAAGWHLSGQVDAVLDAHVATEILVATRTSDAVALFGVRADGPGMSLIERVGIDPLRRMSTVTLVHAPARLLVSSAESLLTQIERRAAVLLACEGVGVADRALDLATEYAKTRVQFDRPIGSYQAVSQVLADSYTEVELARSLTYRAACALADEAENSDDAVACAVHASRRASSRVCEAAIQVSGGIGVTWEFPLHRWYRRALWLDAFHAGRPDPLAGIARALLG